MRVSHVDALSVVVSLSLACLHFNFWKWNSSVIKAAHQIKIISSYDESHGSVSFARLLVVSKDFCANRMSWFLVKIKKIHENHRNSWFSHVNPDFNSWAQTYSGTDLLSSKSDPVKIRKSRKFWPETPSGERCAKFGGPAGGQRWARCPPACRQSNSHMVRSTLSPGSVSCRPEGWTEGCYHDLVVLSRGCIFEVVSRDDFIKAN